MFNIEKITKQFSQSYVLSDFSYHILKGDKINITGRSGIGKTTLFKLLLGFEKPDKGTIFYENQELTDTKVWELRKKIAYVSQDLNIGRGKTQSLFDETLEYKANFQLKSIAYEALYKHLDYFELPQNILQKDISSLSGGEKQRIAIVNALLLKRDIFFLDEVSSALDQALRVKTLDYFLLNPAYTVLSISHDTYLPEGVEIKTLNLE